MSNVDPARAAIPMAQAQRSFDGAFNTLGQLLQSREAMDAKNVVTQQEGLKQQFLDQIAGAKTPEELAALQSSGALTGLRDQMGTAALGAVRGTEEARLGTVRDMITKDYAFKKDERLRTEAPMIDLVKSLVQRKEYAAANQVLGTRDLADEAPLYAAIEGGQRGDKEFGWKEGEQAHQAALRPGQIVDQQLGHDSKRASIQSSRAQAAAAGLQLQVSRDALAETQRMRALDNNVTQMAAQLQAENNKKRDAISGLAKTYAGLIPMTKDGQVDMSQMTSTNKTWFNEQLKKNGIDATLDIYEKGDTANKAAILKAAQAGGAKAGDMARLSGNLDVLLSTAPLAAMGNDAATAAQVARDQELVAQDLKDKYGSISTNSPEEQRTWWTAAQEIIKEAPKNDVRNFNEAVTKYAAEGGIKLADGTKIYMGPEKLQELLRSNLGERSWANPNWTSTSDILDTLLKWDEENATGAGKLLEERNASRLRKSLPGATQSTPVVDKKKK